MFAYSESLKPLFVLGGVAAELDILIKVGLEKDCLLLAVHKHT